MRDGTVNTIFRKTVNKGQVFYSVPNSLLHYQFVLLNTRVCALTNARTHTRARAHIAVRAVTSQPSGYFRTNIPPKTKSLLISWLTAFPDERYSTKRGITVTFLKVCVSNINTFFVWGHHEIIFSIMQKIAMVFEKHYSIVKMWIWFDGGYTFLPSYKKKEIFKYYGHLFAFCPMVTNSNMAAAYFRLLNGGLPSICLH